MHRTKVRARVARLTLIAGATLTLAACGDDPPAPGPGTLTATLVGPNGDEGAAVVALFGDGIESISAIAPTEVFPRLSDGEARVVLINQVGGLLEFRMALADTTSKPDVVIVEVAGPNDELRPDVTPYVLEVAR